MGTRLTQEEKEEIYRMWKSGKYYLYEIAEWFGCHYTTIERILSEKRAKEHDNNNKTLWVNKR